jgi:ribonuclease P protein component
MAVTVPKHLFKRAVRRNLLKRRIREAYRLHKAPLIEYMQHLGRTLALVIKYENKTPDTFALIEGDMLRIFRKLMYEARQLPPAA